MIFINCIKEELVQIGDKTRIDVSQSFANGDSITDITIKPEASEIAISVFSSNQDNWYLDWAYATDGEKTITVEATDGTLTENIDITINIVSEADDNLYSNDSSIFQLENELKKYLPPGKNSYKNLHREARERILSYLDRKRIWKDDGSPYIHTELNLKNELEKWSLYETIKIIYSDLMISVGDKFKDKHDQYRALRNTERDRAAIRIDKNEDGELTSEDVIQDLKSYRMIIR